MQKVYQQAKNSGALLGIAVNGDTLPDLKEFRNRNKVNYPIAIDASDRLFDRFEVGFPTTVLVDRNGIIRLVEEGFVPKEFPKTQSRFAALIAPTKIAPKPGAGRKAGQKATAKHGKKT